MIVDTNLPQKIIIGGENKLPQVVDGTITTITASDLEGATSIRSYAFYKCTSLTSIEIPDSVTSIGDNAFDGCDNLGYNDDNNGGLYLGNSENPYIILVKAKDTTITSCEINSNTKFIYSSALAGCSNLNTITINAITPPSLSNTGAIPSNVTAIYVPSNSVDAYKTATNWSAFADKIQSLPTSASLFTFDNGAVTGYIGEDTEIVIPSSYSIGETKTETYKFASKTELKNFCTSDNNYPYKVVDANGTQKTIKNSFSLLTFTATYPVTYTKTITKYIDGDDYQVTSIGAQVFYFRSKLTSITIPDSVTSIGDKAFYGCSGLEIIVVDGNNSVYDSRNNCNAIIETNSNTLIVGGNNTVIPDSVTSIGESAFKYCSGLTSVTIPASVTRIGDSAFEGCYKLVEVYNLSSLNITKGSEDYGNVGYYALDIYKSLETPSKLSNENGYIFYEDSDTSTYYFMGYNGTETALTLPSKSYNYGIYQYAFYCCDSLTSIEIPDSVTSIGDFAFQSCKGLTSITIPNSVTSIGESAFDGCSGLTSITIGNGIISISNHAFSSCYALASITIPNSVISIGYGAFFKCRSSKSVTIPNSVTSIGGYAFGECYGLTSITIPNSVTSIGESAFNYCNSLTSITIKATTPPTLSNTNAIPSATTTIYIPTGTLSAYQSATNWSSFADKFVEKEMT